MFTNLINRLNDDQRKLLADLLNTLAKLFFGGGMVAPFVGATSIGFISAGFAIISGFAFHGLALAVVGFERANKEE